MRLGAIVILLLSLLCCLPAFAVNSVVEEAVDGVLVVRDDTGTAWGGWSMGVTHQNAPGYEAKKILDLSDMPDRVWGRVQEVRLSAYMMVRDYSGTANPPADGLDEAIEMVVNGNVHTYPTSAGFPVWQENAQNFPIWHDFVIPREEIIRGPNEIIFRKAEGNGTDDYFYLGIDNIQPRGNSAVKFSADEEWTQDRLTIPGANGEYMVRLYLIVEPTDLSMVWRPGDDPALEDPRGVVLYAGARDGEVSEGGLALEPGEAARIEWRAGVLDRLSPAEAVIDATGQITLAWLDEAGAPIEPQEASGAATLSLAAERSERTSGLIVTARERGATIEEVALSAKLDFHPQEQPIDMAPVVAQAPPLPPAKAPSCAINNGVAILGNGVIEARFDTGGDRLRLQSLRHGLDGTEMLRSPEDAWLFLVEVGEQRFAGSRDFRLAGIEPVEGGFTADLRLDPALAAELTVTIDDEGLRMAMELTNAGDVPLDFKLAFPVLQGLAVSDDPAEDYYFYPWGGGVIAAKPALIRGGYGDYQALYQVMDLYAPGKGIGLSLRIDDADGWHKTLALQKALPGQAPGRPTTLTARVRPEYQWTQPSLAEVPGTGLSAEYLRRTREPGGSFAPEPAVLAAHPGDWHVAMERYAAWAHEVWEWRPWPSRLKSCHNMIAAGWATGYLFRDGAYRTDIIVPRTDVIELMSWWDWSETGPFSTPMDRLEEVMTEAEIERWKPYMVEDPVTGQKMWNNAPTDYRGGYNERFGGLPAFREAIETYRELGAKLVTLYTDPFRLHDDSETGRAHGREWGVVDETGEKSKSYLVWNPCHDLPEVREWVAEELGRVMREIGADGIRLDEYGHRGWACYDETHDHTYAEPGITQWNKAVAEATRMIHEAMDEVRPDSVLTTEHPGYDYLMKHLEGCITYDLTVLGLPMMRPLQCNAQRFYFPECRAYELDHQSADLKDRRKFWNAVESFGRYYPLPYYTALSENEDVYQSGDCYPLLVTPGNARHVYINRFEGAGKTIWHLHNSTGHTFDGQALAVELADGQHLFDLLACREITPLAREDGLAGVSLYLEREGIASIVRLQDRLEISRAGDALQVQADLPAGDCQVAICARDGAVLLAQPAAAGMSFDLTQLEEGAEPVCVKLLRGGQMVDVAEMPN